MSAAFIIISIIVIGIPLTVHLAKLKRRTDEAWAAASRKLHLTYQPSRAFSGRRIHGARRGFEVEIKRVREGGGKHAKTFTSYRVRYPELPILILLKKQRAFSGVARFFGSQDIEVGNPEFDDAVVVQSKQPQALMRFLTPARQLRVQRTFQRFVRCSVTGNLAEGMTRGIERTWQSLARNLDTLVNLAAELSSDEQHPTPVAQAMIARREGRLGDALEIVAPETDDEDAQVVRGQLLRTMGRPAEAVAVLAGLRAEIPEDAEIAALHAEASQAEAAARARGSAAPMSALAAYPRVEPTGVLPSLAPTEDALPASIEPASPVEARLASTDTPAPATSAVDAPTLDATEVVADLFGESRMSSETQSLFDERYSGHGVRWEGRIERVETYRNDMVFGEGPGAKVLLELVTVEDNFGGREVRATVQVDEATGQAWRSQRGATFAFEGHLLHCDAFMRNLYVAAGSALSSPPE